MHPLVSRRVPPPPQSRVQRRPSTRNWSHLQRRVSHSHRVHMITYRAKDRLVTSLISARVRSSVKSVAYSPVSQAAVNSSSKRRSSSPSVYSHSWYDCSRSYDMRVSSMSSIRGSTLERRDTWSRKASMHSTIGQLDKR